MLFDFYKCYRACVRAKVAALRADQLTGEAAVKATTEAQKHLALADRYAAPHAKPVLLVIGGLSGSGKSFLAEMMAGMLGAEWLRTDVLRREFEAGYQPEQRLRVYEEMAALAEVLLSEGVSVILDGTFSTANSLQTTYPLAQGPNRLVLYIECKCRSEIARERIQKRAKEGVDPSEATPEVFEKQRQQWEAWPAELRSLQINTDNGVMGALEDVRTRLASLFKATTPT
jgi:predicted kinase